MEGWTGVGRWRDGLESVDGWVGVGGWRMGWIG